jgi:hypothetical protein
MGASIIVTVIKWIQLWRNLFQLTFSKQIYPIMMMMMTIVYYHHITLSFISASHDICLIYEI